MQKIAQGAEAVIYRDLEKNTVMKERFSKKYRQEQLDTSLRGFRTRREAKILQRLEEMNFPSPKLQSFCDERMSIVMDFIPGEKLRDVLENGDDYQQLAMEMGQKIGLLHQKHIVHGDLTTSNILLNERSKELNFIDFGLSQFSEKNEDKAVDLFLLDRALESKHYKLYPQIFDKVVEGYKKAYSEAGIVLERFEQVSKRGRNKKK